MRMKGGFLRIGIIKPERAILFFYLFFGIGCIRAGFFNNVIFIVSLIWIFYNERRGIRTISCVVNEPAMFLFFLFLVYNAFLVPFGDEFALSMKYAAVYVVYFLMLLIYSSLKRRSSPEFMEGIYQFVLNTVIFFAAISIIYLHIHPNFARHLAANEDEVKYLMIGGGYNLAYLTAILMPIQTYRLIIERRKFGKILSIIIMALLLYETRSMITIMVAILCSAISFLLCCQNKFAYVLMSLGVVGIVIYLLRHEIGESLLTYAYSKDWEHNPLIGRLLDLGEILIGNSLDDSRAITMRFSAYRKPLEYILKHPFFGGAFSNGIYGGHDSLFACDSTLVRTTAIYGIPFSMLFIIPVGIVIRDICRSKQCIGSAVALCLLFLLQDQFNVFSFFVSLFLIVPAVASCTAEQNNRTVSHSMIV